MTRSNIWMVMISLLTLMALQDNNNSSSTSTTRVAAASSHEQQQAQSSSSSSPPPADKKDVFRYHNLDYLDTATLQYYLSGPSENFDVAVLYFAQWCNNCHALAPIWDQIAKLMHAGTEHSNLIMALYDCEADMEHMQMCNTAGVKHYPTMQFMSLASSGAKDSDSRNNKNNKGVRLQRKKPHHATIYSGNWQYGDAVYDWLRAMTALSQWHRRGWGKKLRDFVTGAKKPQPKDKPLPIGIPKTASEALELASSSSSSPSSFSSSSSSSSMDAAKIHKLELETKHLNDAVLRSSTFLEAILFPLSTGNYTINDGSTSDSSISSSSSRSSNNARNYTDVFALLADTNGWTSADTTDRILRTCVLDISVDYCGRLASQLTMDLIETQLAQSSDLMSMTDEDITRLSEQLVAQVAVQEPFCPKAEECVAQGMATIETVAYYTACPFHDRNGCRYVTACLSPDIQAEYAQALQKLEEAHQQQQNQQQQATTTTTTTGTPVATKKGWFG